MALQKAVCSSLTQQQPPAIETRADSSQTTAATAQPGERGAACCVAFLEPDANEKQYTWGGSLPQHPHCHLSCVGGLRSALPGLSCCR